MTNYNRTNCAHYSVKRTWCVLAPVPYSNTRYSPIVYIPAEHTNNSEFTQKKLTDCPTSSHDPVSVTFRKNDIVIPSVSVRAIINSENGGKWSLVFKVAKTADKTTCGAAILNIKRATTKSGLKIGKRRKIGHK